MRNRGEEGGEGSLALTYFTCPVQAQVAIVIAPEGERVPATLIYKPGNKDIRNNWGLIYQFAAKHGISVDKVARLAPFADLASQMKAAVEQNDRLYGMVPASEDSDGMWGNGTAVVMAGDKAHCGPPVPKSTIPRVILFFALSLIVDKVADYDPDFQVHVFGFLLMAMALDDTQSKSLRKFKDQAAALYRFTSWFRQKYEKKRGCKLDFGNDEQWAEWLEKNTLTCYRSQRCSPTWGDTHLIHDLDTKDAFYMLVIIVFIFFTLCFYNYFFSHGCIVRGVYSVVLIIIFNLISST